MFITNLVKIHIFQIKILIQNNSFWLDNNNYNANNNNNNNARGLHTLSFLKFFIQIPNKVSITYPISITLTRY